MTRTLVRYCCTACGHESPKWLGRCPTCDEWGSFGEESRAPSRPVTLGSAVAPITEVDHATAGFLPTGVPELDRVLGGGLVPGSVTLVAGEPGMGKSTLLLQALGALAARGVRCLLVSAEESAAQVRLRADRLGTLAPDLLVVSETSLPVISAHIDAVDPVVCAIDSIQTVHDPDAPGVAGSVSQVRDGAQAIVRLAKERDAAILLVGHVTKDGALAGPRLLEHVVDSVLSFEGDRHHTLRMLRALKHRFGPTDELGLMEMTELGLTTVDDPSSLFLADRRPDAYGSVVACILEGARPLCVEVQALVSENLSAISRRISQATDGGRLAMLTAIIQERAKIQLKGRDVYASIAGNIRVEEPGGDLALALAIVGSWNLLAVAPDTVVIGELGLGGEVRQVAQITRRLTEARRLGFTRAVVPMSTPALSGMELVRVPNIGAALDTTPGFDQ